MMYTRIATFGLKIHSTLIHNERHVTFFISLYREKKEMKTKRYKWKSDTHYIACSVDRAIRENKILKFISYHMLSFFHQLFSV